MYQESARRTAAIAGAELVCGNADAALSTFAIDSRKVAPGDAFVCFPGESVDGNDYAAKAVEAGAAAVVATREPDEALVELCEKTGCCLMRAAGDDAEEFLARLAEAYRKRHDWAVVGVTGSVGKTTTKDMLAAALATRYRVHKNVGNYNSVIGVPLTVLAAPDDTEVFVCEMGMNHPGEIDRICRCARPQLACVTNIGTSHIGLLGSRENIARAKAECVSWLAEPLPAFREVDPAIVLSSADDFSGFIKSEFAEKHGVATELVGFHEGDAVRASDVALDEDGRPSFSVTGASGTADVSLLLTGRQVVPDFLLCAAVCERLGVSLEEAAGAVSAMEPTSMRTEVVKAARGFRILDDSYNASPSSLAAALDVLCEMACDNRRIAVVGEVGELGDEAPRLHGLMGAYVAAKPLDLVVFVGGENAETMQEAAFIMGLSEDRAVLVPDVEAAIATIGPVLEAGDLVLAKGSRSVGLDRFVKEVRA